MFFAIINLSRYTGYISLKKRRTSISWRDRMVRSAYLLMLIFIFTSFLVEKDKSSIKVEPFFNLVLANAYAQNLIPINFVLGTFGASDGQVLVFNASANQWMPQAAGLGPRAIQLSHLSSMGRWMVTV